MFTTQAKIDEIKRELSFRRRVYPRKAAEEPAQAPFLNRRMKIMEAILEDYEAKLREESPMLL